MTLSTTEAASPSVHPTGAPPLHHTTPLLYSPALSHPTSHHIYLKLDSSQPSGSFKLRGIGHVSTLALAHTGAATHLVSSSGGNAGLAVAYSAQRLGLAATVFLPVTTEARVVRLLQAYGARVVVGGESWNEADGEARRFADTLADGCGRYVHPFEGEELVRGHSSLVDEVRAQMPEGASIDVVICAVGGGGLLSGLLHGLQRPSPPSSVPAPPACGTRVVGVQCYGADSFVRSHLASTAEGVPRVVQLDSIQSRASSMGTKACSSATLAHALAYPHFTAVRVDDDLAASAVWQFRRDHATLVELSCGAALAPVYFSRRILDTVLHGERGKNVVVVVCGGSKVDEEMVAEYRQRTGEMVGRGRADVDGVEV